MTVKGKQKPVYSFLYLFMDNTKDRETPFQKITLASKASCIYKLETFLAAFQTSSEWHNN